NARAQAAISVSGTPLTYSGGVIGINQANGSQAGYLSSTDWNTFNNKISSSSLSGGTGISYNSSTGVIGNTGVTSLSGTANQITASASTGAVTLSLPSTVDGINTLGVGTTSPFTTLSVQGNGYLSGNLTAANITATGTVNA